MLHVSYSKYPYIKPRYLFIPEAYRGCHVSLGCDVRHGAYNPVCTRLVIGEPQQYNTADVAWVTCLVLPYGLNVNMKLFRGLLHPCKTSPCLFAPNN